VDLLAHPGLLKPEEAELAAENGIFLEITSRAGHSLCNGRVARVGREAGARFLVNSDSHSHNDLYRGEFQRQVALGSGLSQKEYEEIIRVNQKKFLEKIGYS
jgi:putative hydrolase